MFSMTRTGFALLCLLLAISSCKKDNNTNPLLGTWELRQVFGGWTGITNYETGNGNLAVFSDNGQYTRTVVTTDTSYTLVYKYSIVEPDECNENLLLSSIGDNNGFRQHATVSHDSLFISDGSCIADGNALTYVRK